MSSYNFRVNIDNEGRILPLASGTSSRLRRYSFYSMTKAGSFEAARNEQIRRNRRAELVHRKENFTLGDAADAAGCQQPLLQHDCG
eukprot:1551436-Amphidinium_carterae.4